MYVVTDTKFKEHWKYLDGLAFVANKCNLMFKKLRNIENVYASGQCVQGQLGKKNQKQKKHSTHNIMQAVSIHHHDKKFYVVNCRFFTQKRKKNYIMFVFQMMLDILEKQQ